MMPPPSALLIVPARPLRRLAPVAFEHPVAELAAHREHAAEEAGVAQHPDLAQSRQEQLVLHDAVLHFLLLWRVSPPRSPCRACRRPAFRNRRACRPRSPASADRRASASSPHRRTPRRRGFSAPRRDRSSCARCRTDCASAATFSALRPTRIGSGITRSPFGSATPPCSRMARIERTRCWLSPMRPVTPYMTMPSLRVAMSVAPTLP